MRFQARAIIYLGAFVLHGALFGPALAAQGDDPEWPCIQRKVPELSLAQIWTGPELPQSASEWAEDPEVSDLVAEVAARRVPLAEAEQTIRDFAASLSPDEREVRLTKLVKGLFDHMNRERSQVISGIGRYAHKQRDLADALRKEASAVDALRAKTDADPNEVAVRNDRIVFQTRIFQERVQSLTFVCEVPTLIEQRLYALTKTISQTLENR
nr:heat-inducible transcriptional repressor HrcA [Rhizobium sp. Khangiran2]